MYTKHHNENEEQPLLYPKKYCRISIGCITVFIGLIFFVIIYSLVNFTDSEPTCHDEFPDNNIIKCTIVHHCIHPVFIKKHANYRLYSEVTYINDKGHSVNTSFSNHDFHMSSRLSQSSLPKIGTTFDCMEIKNDYNTRVYDINKGYCNLKIVIPPTCIIIDYYTV